MRSLPSAVPPLVVVALLVASAGGPLSPFAAGAQEPVAGGDVEADRGAAREAAAEGRWEEAALAWQRVLAERPDDGRAWFGLGEARHRLSRLTEALRAYERAFDARYNPARVAFHAARAAATMGDLPTALDWLERLADTGSTAHLAVANAEELAPLVGTPRFERVLDRLSPCARPGYDDFDFWLGEWTAVEGGEVVEEGAALDLPEAAVAPVRESVREILDGCALRHEYRAPSGYAGTSLVFYDRGAELWHQTWIDNQGRSWALYGGPVDDGGMVLAEPAGSLPRNRMTWTPRADGTVRQLWEVSTDDGETWSVVSDTVFRRTDGGGG